MTSTPKPGLPPATRPLLAFQVFNSMNFTLALGAPLVLVARHVGATESVVGLLNALTPLLVILQLPGASLVDRYGCRRVMMAGWGLRSVFLLMIAPLPLLVGLLPTGALVGLMILGVAGFNAVRGITSAAWFPWLKSLLPSSVQGRFLGVEQRLINISAFATLIACGLFLGEEPGPWRYGAIFVFAFGAGMLSVWMLSRVPETLAGVRSQLDAPSWRRMVRNARMIWSHAPFRRTTRYAAVFALAMMAQGIFLVLFVREVLEYSEGMVLKFQATATLGVLTTAVWWGTLSDRIGSRPLLRLCDIGIFSVFTWWTLVAFGLIHPGAPSIFVIYFVGGVFVAAHAVAQTRLTLACLPKREVTFALAMFAVINSMIGGMGPVIFGYLLEQIRPHLRTISEGLPFAILFAIFVLLGIASQWLLGLVPEQGRIPTRQVLAQVLYDWPMRVLSGLASGGRRPRI